MSTFTLPSVYPVPFNDELNRRGASARLKKALTMAAGPYTSTPDDRERSRAFFHSLVVLWFPLTFQAISILHILPCCSVLALCGAAVHVPSIAESP